MQSLSQGPSLGHITTFGGHPLIAAAALATLEELTTTELIPETLVKEARIRERLQHPLLCEIRGKGLMLALIFPTAELARKIIEKALDNGLILFGLLFESRAVRISPPLTISMAEIDLGCDKLLKILEELAQ